MTDYKQAEGPYLPGSWDVDDSDRVKRMLQNDTPTGLGSFLVSRLSWLFCAVSTESLVLGEL
jgi:hypothetical protein